MSLSDTHRRMLEVESAITAGVIEKRGYRTITDAKELKSLGFSKVQCLVPALLIPGFDPKGNLVGYQLRPENPRLDRRSKAIKYETQAGRSLWIDAPPDMAPLLADPSVDLWITEGAKKADAFVSRAMNACIVAVLGVYAWKEADWDGIAIEGRIIYIAFDSDVMTKLSVRKALIKLASFLKRKGAKDVRPVIIPSAKGAKAGLDDYFADQGKLSKLRECVDKSLIAGEAEAKPSILVSRGIQEVTEDAIKALAARNDPPAIFVRNGRLVRLQRDEKFRYQINQLTSAQLRNELGKCAHWMRGSDEEPSKVFAPKDIAENILAEGNTPEGFPPIEGLSSAPVLSPSSGAARRQKGYDPDSRWFVADPGPWPSWPGSAQDAAAYILDEVFGDFPFENDASKVNALALLLLPFLRALIDGPTPMHFVDAPASGTGKSLLVRAALLPAMGMPPPATPIPVREEEFSKLLFSMLSQGEQAIFLDNLRGRLNSTSLEACLTSDEYKARLLNVSEAPTVSVRAIFALTANNGDMTKDARRRCVHIRLDSKEESPEDRREFKHPSLLKWIKENRGKIVAAALAVCEHWISIGKPPGAAHKATYEEYAFVLSGVLESVGLTAFLTNSAEFMRSPDGESEDWLAFYEAWFDKWGGEPVIVKELKQLAHERDLLSGVFEKARNDRGEANALGVALKSRIGVVLKGSRIEQSTISAGLSRYKMTRLGGLVDCGVPQRMTRLIDIDPPIDDAHAEIAHSIIHQSTNQVQNLTISPGQSTKTVDTEI